MRGVRQRVGELYGSLLEEMEPLQHFGCQQHALLVEKLVALAHELALVGKLDHRAARRRHLTHAATLPTPAELLCDLRIRQSRQFGLGQPAKHGPAGLHALFQRAPLVLPDQIALEPVGEFQIAAV